MGTPTGAGLPGPTDPADQQATIDHLRDLITRHSEADAVEPSAPAAKAQKPVPASHDEWVEEGREIALRQLNFSARSSAQLREAMLAREVPPAAAQEVIDRLTRVGLVNDAEYAAMLVRTRQSERGLARRGLSVELAKKGIDPDIAAAALEQVDERDEAEAARALVRKRVSSMRALDPTKRRNRLYGTLARKGYTSSAARAAIDEVLTEEGLELY